MFKFINLRQIEKWLNTKASYQHMLKKAQLFIELNPDSLSAPEWLAECRWNLLIPLQLLTSKVYL